MTILLVLVALSFIALIIHEGGHLLASSMLGATPKRIALGIGPILACTRWRGAAVEFRALPFAGSVDADFSGQQFEHLRRAASIAAGPLTNICAAFAFLAAALYIGLPISSGCPESAPPSPPTARCMWLPENASASMSHSAALTQRWISSAAALFLEGRKFSALQDGERLVRPSSALAWTSIVLLMLAVSNLGTGVFNALPVPGLDGSAFLGSAVRVLGISLPPWTASVGRQLVVACTAAILLRTLFSS